MVESKMAITMCLYYVSRMFLWFKELKAKEMKNGANHMKPKRHFNFLRQLFIVSLQIITYLTKGPNLPLGTICYCTRIPRYLGTHWNKLLDSISDYNPVSNVHNVLYKIIEGLLKKFKDLPRKNHSRTFWLKQYSTISYKTRKTNSDFCLNFCASEAHTKVWYETNLCETLKFLNDPCIFKIMRIPLQ